MSLFAFDLTEKRRFRYSYLKSRNFLLVTGSLLSGEDIWINLLTQKRYTVHIDGCDIWNDLRPFLNFLVHPFSSKLRSKEAKGLKSGTLGKQNFFLHTNFLVNNRKIKIFRLDLTPKFPETFNQQQVRTDRSKKVTKQYIFSSKKR